MKAFVGSFLFFAVTTLFGRAAETRKIKTSSFVPRNNRAHSFVPQRALAFEVNKIAILDIPRGGGVLLDPDLAAKLFIYTYGANAAFWGLFFKLGMKAFGLAEDLTNEFTIRTIGSIGMSTSVLLYLQKMKGMDFLPAVGWASVPGLLTSIYHVVSGMDKTLGYLPVYPLPECILDAATWYACTNGLDVATLFVKMVGIFGLLNGLVVYFMPKEAAAALKISLRSGDANLLPIANLGYFMVNIAITYLLPSFLDITLNQTMSWVALVTAIAILRLNLFSNYFELGTTAPKAVDYPLIAALMFFAASLRA